MNNLNKFIVTEILETKGEASEKLVWDSIIRAFINRKCLAYWRYPIFEQQGFRKEPDILIADYQLGLIVIEVKGIKIEQLVGLVGHRWQYQNFYTQYGNPYQQAERQLFALLSYSEREPLLKQQISARAVVALPNITQTQWQQKGFARQPNSPPILFSEQLADVDSIINSISQTPPIISGSTLTNTQWELWLSVLGGTAIYTPPEPKNNCTSPSKRKYIQQVRSRLNQLDLNQEKIAKQIPPGMQRIRGIAGSGKTVILCQKAALMSVKYPQWEIALVFFSRSLYSVITQQIKQWIRYFSAAQISYDPQKSRLKILHAWGSKQQPGFYGTVCRAAGEIPLSVPFTVSKQPHEALAEACVRLLENSTIPAIFDAVLIDEAQDLISNNWRYQDKQPFYWLAYQSLRPVNPIAPQQRRLIWAYDELQSLSSLKIPEPAELFGEELGHLVTGKYSQQLNKTEIISRCYRTPHQIIIIAQAIALGLLRKRGLLTGSIYPEEWQALGFKINGDWQLGNQITLIREPHNSPNIISQLWQGSMISFARFPSRQQELTVLAQKIRHNLTQDHLQPDRDILIIVLGGAYDAAELAKQTATFLINQGIKIYLPSQPSFNSLDQQQLNPNQFWYPGATTVSTIHRAKGQCASQVYLVGLDRIAIAEANLYLRHQLYVALTRTTAWIEISGIGSYALYQELAQLIDNYRQLTFTLSRLPPRELRISDRASLIHDYALGRVNFRNADLSHADLCQTYLAGINFIGADLSYANLRGTNLTNAKLIAANLSNADLSHANLTNAKLIGADLTQTNLTKANLTNTLLS